LGNARLSGTLVAADEVAFPFGLYAWSSDGSRVVYRLDDTPAVAVELFSATPDGVVVNRLSGPLVPRGNVINFEVR
jgi:hypothetical protein